MKNPYYITTFGKHTELLNANSLFPLPEDTKYGDLSLKLMNLAQTVRFINLKSEFIYKTFNEVRTETEDLIQSYKNSENYSILSREIETVVYFVRRSIDELISLIYVLDYNLPSKVEIDDISKLINSKDVGENLQILKDNYSDFLIRLNNASNAYKHSFLNSEGYNLLGRDEPCVLVLGLKGNDLKNGFRFDSISLGYILSSFKDFLEDSLEILKEYSVNEGKS
jgi:hypothetical protein